MFRPEGICVSSNTLALALFALDVPFALATGAVARFRGRRWSPWALFGLVMGPFAFVAVLVVGRGSQREVDELRSRVAALEEHEVAHSRRARVPVYPPPDFFHPDAAASQEDSE
jgi:hypothetical protein